MVIILKEKEAEDFLEHHHFPVVKRLIVRNHAELEASADKIGFPLVLKNPSFLHKTEKKGVYLNVTKENLGKTYSLIKAKHILIQKQLYGVELLLGIKKDDVFGHALVCGLGGTLTELINDISFRICPLKENDIHSMLHELKVYPILNGFRNKKYKQKKVISIIKKLSMLPQQHPEIQELDINPLIVDEKNATIVDARITMNKKSECTSRCRKT